MNKSTDFGWTKEISEVWAHIKFLISQKVLKIQA
jgi:hypothetical protein